MLGAMKLDLIKLATLLLQVKYDCGALSKTTKKCEKCNIGLHYKYCQEFHAK